MLMMQPTTVIPRKMKKPYLINIFLIFMLLSVFK